MGPHKEGSGWTALLDAAHGGPDVSPYAGPARSADLSTSGTRWSPSPIRSGDPLGQPSFTSGPGGFHGFDTLAPDLPLSRDARAARLAWLRRVLDARSEE